MKCWVKLTFDCVCSSAVQISPHLALHFWLPILVALLVGDLCCYFQCLITSGLNLRQYDIVAEEKDIYIHVWEEEKEEPME